MIALNTTDAWNCGDAFIRMGVLRLLGVPTLVSKYYVNRCQVQVTECGSDTKTLADTCLLRAERDDVMRTAAAFVCAGTPEWVNRAEAWWDAAVAHNVPVAICGIGRSQPLERVMAAKRAGLIAGVTVRDTQAEQTLRHRAGVDARWFPCPSTAAVPKSYRTEPKDIPFVVVPRLQCGLSVARGSYWAEIASGVGLHADLIAVHEPAEIQLARDLFGREDVFYSSRPSDYLELYARARVVLAGRLHAALPTVAAGGTAYLVDIAPKFEAAARMQHELGADGPLRVIPTSRTVEIEPRDSTRFLERLDAANADHAAYWAERTSEWF